MLTQLAQRHRQTLRLEPLEDRFALSTVGYWRFEKGEADTRAHGANSIIDESGNDLHGTPLNGPVYRNDVKDNPIPQTGQSNLLSMQFNGINQRIFVSDQRSFALTKSLTIEAYIKRTGPQSWHGQILFRGDDRSALDPYYLAVSGNDLLFHVENAQGQQAHVSEPLPTLNKWFHVAGTLNNGTGAMKLYIDGKEVDSITTTVRPFAQLDPSIRPGVGIGSLQGDFYCCQFFHGFIDELRLSDRALRPAQFLNAPTFIAPPPPINAVTAIGVGGIAPIDTSLPGSRQSVNPNPAAARSLDYDFISTDNGFNESTATKVLARSRTKTAHDLYSAFCSVGIETEMEVIPELAPYPVCSYGGLATARI